MCIIGSFANISIPVKITLFYAVLTNKYKMKSVLALSAVHWVRIVYFKIVWIFVNKMCKIIAK